MVVVGVVLGALEVMVGGWDGDSGGAGGGNNGGGSGNGLERVVVGVVSATAVVVVERLFVFFSRSLTGNSNTGAPWRSWRLQTILAWSKFAHLSCLYEKPTMWDPHELQFR